MPISIFTCDYEQCSTVMKDDRHESGMYYSIISSRASFFRALTFSSIYCIFLWMMNLQLLYLWLNQSKTNEKKKSSNYFEEIVYTISFPQLLLFLLNVLLLFMFLLVGTFLILSLLFIFQSFFVLLCH